jgi:hypothetical protein
MTAAIITVLIQTLVWGAHVDSIDGWAIDKDRYGCAMSKRVAYGAQVTLATRTDNSLKVRLKIHNKAWQSLVEDQSVPVTFGFNGNRGPEINMMNAERAGGVPGVGITWPTVDMIKNFEAQMNLDIWTEDKLLVGFTLDSPRALAAMLTCVDGMKDPFAKP